MPSNRRPRMGVLESIDFTNPPAETQHLVITGPNPVHMYYGYCSQPARNGKYTTISFGQFCVLYNPNATNPVDALSSILRQLEENHTGPRADKLWAYLQRDLIKQDPNQAYRVFNRASSETGMAQLAVIKEEYKKEVEEWLRLYARTGDRKERVSGSPRRGEIRCRKGVTTPEDS